MTGTSLLFFAGGTAVAVFDSDAGAVVSTTGVTADSEVGAAVDGVEFRAVERSLTAADRTVPVRTGDFATGFAVTDLVDRLVVVVIVDTGSEGVSTVAAGSLAVSGATVVASVVGAGSGVTGGAGSVTGCA